MRGNAGQMWVRLPGGRVKGPFDASKVFRTLRAGRVPEGSLVAESSDGPWVAAPDYFAREPWSSVSLIVVAPPLVAPRRLAPSDSVARPIQLSTPSQSVPATPASDLPSRAAESESYDSAPLPTTAMRPQVPRVDAADELDGPLAVGAVLSAAWSVVRRNYWAIVLRSTVAFLIAGALLALPTALWVTTMLAGYFIDLSDLPWIQFIQGSTLLLQIVLPLFLVPFGFMFLVCGALMVLGVCEGSEFRRWSTLLEWRKRFLVMYAMGYVATGAELAMFFLQILLFERGAKHDGMLERALGGVLYACPIAFLVLAGMFVLVSLASKGVLQTITESLRWAIHGLKRDGFAAFIAVGAAVLIAVVSAILVLPFPFIGLPVLLAVIAVVFRRLQRLSGQSNW
jgi:hypothetical protein